MHRKQLTVSVAFALVAFAGLAQTTTPPVRATLPDAALDRAVAAALANAPELSAGRAEVEAARRRIEPARALPDPSASISYDGDRRMVSVMGSQAIPWPGKRALAADVARSEAAALESGVIGRASLALEARVRNAYYDIALAQAIGEVTTERRHITQQLEEIARTRYAAGLVPQQDVLRSQIDLARIDEIDNQQRAVIAARTIELERLTGAAVQPGHVIFDANIPANDALIAAAIQRSPELAAAAASSEAARTRIAAAKTQLLPDFVVSAGPMIGSMSKSYSVGAGVTLPLYQRQKQKNQIAAAEALAGARSNDIETITRDLEIRTRERIASLDAAIRTARLYREKIVPLDRLAVESAMASYESGKVPLITVLEAIHALHDDDVAFYLRAIEAAKWRVAIDEVSLGATAMSTASTSPSASSSSSSAGMAPSM